MLVIENCNSLSDLRQKLIDGEEVRTVRQEPCEDWYDVPSDEMTLEQARQAVKDLRKKLAECLDQEPCEDAISRQAVLDKILKFSVTDGRSVSVTGLWTEVNELPSVTPQEPCEDAISREDALMALCRAVHKNDDTIPCPNQRVSCLWSKTKVQDYAEEIYKLSPVTPKPTKPKTAHWVYKIYGGFHEQGDWYCSHCDYQFNYGNGHAKHCPECGYEMSEAPTEEVIGDRDYDWVIKR